MPKGKATVNGYSRYIVKAPHHDHIPLETSARGASGILTLDGINMADIPSALVYVDRGGILELKRTFKSLQCRVLVIEDHLFAIATKILRTGCHSACWWHPRCGCVWWSYEQQDEEGVLKGKMLHITGADTIRQWFMGVKNVQDVRIIRDAVPDLRKDSRWVEVYPGNPI